MNSSLHDAALFNKRQQRDRDAQLVLVREMLDELRPLGFPGAQLNSVPTRTQTRTKWYGKTYQVPFYENRVCYVIQQGSLDYLQIDTDGNLYRSSFSLYDGQYQTKVDPSSLTPMTVEEVYCHLKNVLQQHRDDEPVVVPNA